MFVSVAGNLTKDAEQKFTKNGKSYLTFSIAENTYKNGEKKTDFHNCTCFGDFWENTLPYLVKGKGVAIYGEMDFSEYEGKEYRKIIVRNLQFISDYSKKTDSLKQQSIEEDREEEMEDDGLPF
jgi:single stranded DNA-binding protein